jgi:TusA-related sulfurtransferase
MGKITADKVQDSIGQACPMPIVNMAKSIRAMTCGQVLELWADDEGAHTDVRAWCTQTGNEFLGEEDAGSHFKYFIRKKA